MSKNKERQISARPAPNRLPSLSITIDIQNAFALLRQGRLDESESLLRKVVKEEPKQFDARQLLGLIELQRRNFKAAAQFIGQALRLDPNSAQAHVNFGNALRGLGRHEEAILSFERALAIQPNLAVAFFNRGDALFEIGRHDEARASLDGALAIDPEFVQARFARCMAELPVIYVNEAEIAERRAAYQRSLEELSGFGLKAANGIGTSQPPFYLAYQGRDDRDLQALYGSFVCDVAAQRLAPANLPPPPGPNEPVRVGIVSVFFRNHANWRVPIKGWLTQLDRRQFRIFGYSTAGVEDDETRVARALCDRFVTGPLSLANWRAQILSDAPHVLIYPEIGMDAVATGLASQRLAPVQCNSWGHPETSGFPTLDYFLSSDLMEPPDGKDHYTEKLVRLPNLSVYLEPVDPPAMRRARRDFGLRASATVYWCGQSLYKFLPRHDEIFPRIALVAGDCQFVFIQYRTGGRVTETFRERLNRAFSAKGLRADEHCVFLPRLSQDEFIAATGLADVYLDSPGWSGCNSTIESLLYDMPIVTTPGALMRGRHSAAMLEMMEVTDTIGETIDDYVAIAGRLATDKPWRTAVRAKVASNKHLIYRDRAPVSALENFLNRVARQQGE